jgi:hypothetical protein
VRAAAPSVLDAVGNAAIREHEELYRMRDAALAAATGALAAEALPGSDEEMLGALTDR